MISYNTATITRWLQSSSDSALMKTCSTQRSAKLLRRQSHTVFYGEDSRRYMQLCNRQVSTLIGESHHVQIMPFVKSTRTQPFLQIGRAETERSTLLFQNCRRLQRGKMCHHKKRANKGKDTWPWSFAPR